MFLRVVGADRFRPLRDHPPVGDACRQWRGKCFGVVHGYVEFQSLQTRVGTVTRVAAASVSAATTHSALARLVSALLRLGHSAIYQPIAFDDMHCLALRRAEAVYGGKTVHPDA